MRPIPIIRAVTVKQRIKVRKIFSAALKKIASNLSAELDTTQKAAALKRSKLNAIVVDVMDEEFENEVAAALAVVAKDGASLALTHQLGASKDDELFDVVNEHAVTWAKEHGGELVTGVSKTTQEAIAELVAKAEQEGWSNETLADALEESFFMSPERANTIARTETAYASVQGCITAYKESGLVTGMQWLTAKDEKVSDECEANDGEIREFGEEFPSGATEPPGHPNCRCTVIPMLRDPDEQYAEAEK